MKKTLITFLVLLFASQITTFAIEEVVENSTLSINDCIEIAIEHSHHIKAHKAYLDLEKSKVGQTKSNYFPSINAGIGHEYGNIDSKYNSIQDRNSKAKVALNQLIYSFGKVYNKVKMQKFYQIAAQYDLDNSILQVTNMVKSAYYGVLKAQAELDIEKANVLLNEKQLERTKKFYNSGKVKKIDLVNQEAYLSDSKIRLIEAQDELNVAIIHLNKTMHLHDAPNYNVVNVETFNFEEGYGLNKISHLLNDNNSQIKEDHYTFKKYPYTQEECVHIAFEKRPDINSMKAVYDAVNEALKFSKKSYLPDLTGSVGYDWNNNNYYSKNGINVGAFLTTNNLNVMDIKYKIDEQKAQLEIAKQNIHEVKCHADFEIQEYYTIMKKLENNIPILEEKVRKTLEYYELANERYEQNKGSFIELQNAKENYTKAQLKYIDNIYQYNIQLTELKTSMGER